MTSVQEQLGQLVAHKTFDNFSQLHAAVKQMVGEDVFFDCFEELKPGLVVIRRSPVGEDDGACHLVARVKSVVQLAA